MTANAERLRIFFITEDDPIYVVNFFETFLREYPENEIEICGITVDRAFHESIWATAKRLLRFYGPIDFLRMAGRYLVAKLSRRSIGRLAEEAGLPMVETASVNGSEYLDRLEKIAPDVVVSVAAPQIFKKRLLSLPKLGCINIHCGQLPTYRGMMPVFWQMQNGEDHITMSVHDMVSKLDAGSVLGTREFPLRERDCLDRVIRGTKQESARLMIDVLRRVARGEAERKPLEMNGASYFSFPTRQDVYAFSKLGHTLL